MSGPYSPMGQRGGPFPLVLPSQVHTSGVAIGGHGSPEGVVPSMPGQVYVDVDNDDLWMKFASTGANGWQLIGTVPPSSGGGSGQSPVMSINYVGPPIPIPPAISPFVVDVNGRIWVYWGGQWN